MDFIVDLPMTMKDHNAIFVVVDLLSKQAHFVPTKLMATISKKTQLFIKEIHRLHGLPIKNIFDRDSKFFSSF